LDFNVIDLYDETLMPADLRKAHQANDRAVMEAYGMWGKVHSVAACVAVPIVSGTDKTIG